MLRIVSFRREQDGGGEGGCGAHLSPQIHQEYTFRHRSACRTPAESRQEQLTSRKVYVEPCKTRDQTLSLWRWSTDSKTLDYQRTNPKEYQIVRTHTKEITWIQDMASPNHHSTLWKTPHLNNKVKSEIEVAQWCLILCDPMDCSLPGSSLHGILQARVLEWVAISFSRGSSRPRDWTQVSRIAGRCFNLWATREALRIG